MRHASAFLAAAITLAILVGPGGTPAALAKGSGDKEKIEVDHCALSAHGLHEHPADRARGGRDSTGGSGKTPLCSKTFAKWSGTSIAVYIDTSGTPSSLGAASFEDYAKKAFTEWSCHSGLGESVAITYVTSASAAGITIGWGNLGTSGVLGQASTSYWRGEILGSEITMNSNQASFTWTLGPAPRTDGGGCEVEIGDDGAATSYDLFLVLLHEIGHGLGCSHPNNRCRSNDPRYFETMYSCTDAGEYSRRALNPGDRLSISRLYGSQP